MDLSALLNPAAPDERQSQPRSNLNRQRPDHVPLRKDAADAPMPVVTPTIMSAAAVYTEPSLPYVATRSSTMHEPDQVPTEHAGLVVQVDAPSPAPTLGAADDEHVNAKHDPSPTQDVDGGLDDATLQAINNAQNQFGTRVRRADASSTREDSTEANTKAEPKPLSKKRPKSATSKANKKRPSKKPRLDSPTTSHRSNTPSSIRKSSKTPAARSTPLDAPSSSSEEPESDPDDTNLYCICRKPDNHTWMIGCDGGCEDWFHGKCVGMAQADEPLLDKFICPNCEEKEVGVTTWKPMCRREGCRNPARLKKGAESKYCSEDCGKRFMQAKVKEIARYALSPTPSKGRRRNTNTNADEDDAHVDLGPLGGPIRPHELATLTRSAASLEVFKSLGNPPNAAALPTPPTSAISPTFERKNPLEQQDTIFTPDEAVRLAEIAARKDKLRARRVLLKDREQFVGLVKAHAASNLEKQQCGFDPRLSWDEATFAAWRASETGRAALSEGGKLQTAKVDDADAMDEDDKDKKDEVEVCLRKRCHRHLTWQKLALQDVRFEEADVGDEMRRVDGEEREIRERARARSVGIDVITSEPGAEGGWVEVVS